ncbi:MAG: porin [Epsilonproteobacteria bacterium]|nr:porin [Campylobacterota bacterium]
MKTNHIVVALAVASTVVVADDIKLKPYGFLRVDAIGHSAEFNNNQAPILVQKQPAGREVDTGLTIHPRLTRLGVDISKELDAESSLNGRVEVDFQNGGSESRELLRLRHAYIEYQKDNYSILAGQTWQTVSRMYPTVNADTLMWGTGNTGDRSPQIRFAYHLPVASEGKLDFEVALQQIGTVENKGQAKTNFGSQPAYQGRVAFGMPIWTEQPMHIALGYHTATETIAEKGFGEKEFDQTGIFAELELPITSYLSLRGEYFSGKNISDLRGGILLGLNPITDEEVDTTGYWIESSIKATDAIHVSLGYSQDDPDDEQVVAGYPSLNEATWATVHYKALEDLTFGMEMIRWATEYKNDQRLAANRLNGFVKWEF